MVRVGIRLKLASLKTNQSLCVAQRETAYKQIDISYPEVRHRPTAYRLKHEYRFTIKS